MAFKGLRVLVAILEMVIKVKEKKTILNKPNILQILKMVQGCQRAGLVLGCFTCTLLH